MGFETRDFLTFMYPALYFVLGVIYVWCAKFSKPNFFIGYRNKLNRRDPTLWKISNFVSGILFLCFAFFHACVILALIAVKYIREVEAFTTTYLVFISEFIWVVELCLVSAITNAFTRWAKSKLDAAAAGAGKQRGEGEPGEGTALSGPAGEASEEEKKEETGEGSPEGGKSRGPEEGKEQETEEDKETSEKNEP